MTEAPDDRRDDTNAGTAELLALERALASALRAPDPVSALARATEGLSPEHAGALARIAPDGLRIAALLVARLRFERLAQGSSLASQWFEDDPAGFAAAFRRYHAEVPASAIFPADEGVLFAAWHERQDP